MYLTNKKNIILVDAWTLDDLGDSEFWDSAFKMLSLYGTLDNPLEFTEELDPVIEERIRKNQMIEFLWTIVPSKPKLSFFENEYTLFYIWVDNITSSLLVGLHDSLIKKQTAKVNSIIKNSSVYKKMLETRDIAFSDMEPVKETKDVVLMKFYDKLVKEKVITFNTPEYVMLSGIDEEEVLGVKEKLLSEEYKILYQFSYQSTLNIIPIYVLQPTKK